MANLKNVVYLTNEQYTTLITNGEITVDDQTVNYDPNDLYLTPEIAPEQPIGVLECTATEYNTWQKIIDYAIANGPVILKGTIPVVSVSGVNAGNPQTAYCWAQTKSIGFIIAQTGTCGTGIGSIYNYVPVLATTAGLCGAHGRYGADVGKVWTAIDQGSEFNGEWRYPIANQVVPTVPADASTKTYVLKLVNNILTWVEEA